jgi:hypothetical protein
MSTERARFWLRAAAATVVVFGGLIVLGAHPATAWPVASMADLIFWPFDGRQTVGAPATRLLSAITGGVMVGWGVMLWLVADRLLPRDPHLAAALIRNGSTSWFIVDSLGSLAAGAPLNVLGNAVFLAIFLLPLARLRPYLTDQGTTPHDRAV